MNTRDDLLDIYNTLYGLSDGEENIYSSLNKDLGKCIDQVERKDELIQNMVNYLLDIWESLDENEKIDGFRHLGFTKEEMDCYIEKDNIMVEINYGEALKQWSELFKMATPQECADMLGKIVIDECGNKHYPQDKGE